MRTGLPQPTVEPGRQSGRMFDATPDRINWLEHSIPLPPSCPKLVARARKAIEDSEAELQEEEEQQRYEKEAKRKQTLSHKKPGVKPKDNTREQFPGNIVSFDKYIRIAHF